MASSTSLYSDITSRSWNGSAWEYSETVTVPEGADFIVVRLGTYKFNSLPTFGGEDMTLILDANDGGMRAASMYYITSPVAGSYDFVVLGSSQGSSLAIDSGLAIDSISDVTGLGDFDSYTEYSDSASVTLTTVADDLVLDIYVTDVTGTPTAGQALQLDNEDNTSAGTKQASGTSHDASWSRPSSDRNALIAAVFTNSASLDYTVRKGATGVTVTHTLTADGISTATLNGESLTIDSQSGQDVVLDFDDSIVASGEYDLVLTDSAAATETLTVQYNVFGLASDTIQKDGVDIGAQTDIELVVLTGAEGSRVVAEQQSALTTDSNGITGATILNDAGLVDTTAVYVVWQSATADVQWSYETTVELI